MQMSKFRSSLIDIIVLYRSQRGNYIDLNEHIEMMDVEEKPLLVIGDFNFCFQTSPNNQTKQFFERKQFTQMIDEPTHIEGHLLDQAYLKDKTDTLKWSVEVQSKYYTDHKGLAITINKDCKETKSDHSKGTNKLTRTLLRRHQSNT